MQRAKRKSEAQALRPSGDMSLGWDDEEEDDFLLKASQMIDINDNQNHANGEYVLDASELAEITRLAAEGDADWWNDDNENEEEEKSDSQRFHQTDTIFNNNNAHNVLDYKQSLASSTAMAPPPPKRQRLPNDRNATASAMSEEDVHQELQRLRGENQRIRDEHYRQLGETLSLREEQSRLKSALLKEKMDRERELELKKEELRHKESSLQSALERQKTENEFLQQELKQARDKAHKKGSNQTPTQQAMSTTHQPQQPIRRAPPASIDHSLLGRPDGKRTLTKEIETQTTARAKRQLKLHLRCLPVNGDFGPREKGENPSGHDSTVEDYYRCCHFNTPPNSEHIQEVLKESLNRQHSDFEHLDWLCHSLPKGSQLQCFNGKRIDAVFKETGSIECKRWLLRMILTGVRLDLIDEKTLTSFLQSPLLYMSQEGCNADLKAMQLLTEICSESIAKYKRLNCQQGCCEQERLGKLIAAFLERHKYSDCNGLVRSYFDLCLQTVSSEAIFASKCPHCLPNTFMRVSKILKQLLETFFLQSENVPSESISTVRSGTLLLFHCCSRRRKQIVQCLTTSGIAQRHHFWLTRALGNLKHVLNLNSLVDVFAELSMENEEPGQENN